jgi:hypothetical protein
LDCTLFGLRCMMFLGFANFYRIFIKDYFKIVVLLNCFIGKEKFV